MPKVKTCLGYDRSEPIYFAQNQKPDVVFMERRYDVDETESIMYRFNFLSPDSKFYLLAANLPDKHLLKNTIHENYEDVFSDCEIHTSVTNLVNDLYQSLSQN